ncbi:hypothetical protein GCM10011583_22850 [Streptomyces camponoticapitis]|uniref:DUF3558 domain-containing protein n=1 Tax=Streptomyces camponoticapitis TaxID=1616125 RepID=A0ABQ2E492_9ACTN|nr:hypothetical protein [Streptomyces camponoticapitis]GGJ90866.1 hypothetical protein GCM10011583_22850 [Streptomyces camponoticapitis]
MKAAVRRWAPYVALSLALAVAAGYGWYRMSDTGKGWRYEESLKTFCEGLIPYEESAGFTGKDGARLSRDYRAGGSEGDYDSCTVAGLDLTIGRIPDSLSNSDGPDVFDRLGEGDADGPPVPLGGGWRGYTDLVNTAVVLACDNKPGSVVVTAQDDDAADASRAQGIAELVAATAVEAAGRWNCDAKAGGGIPTPAAEPERASRFDATGTCGGIPLGDEDHVHWIKEGPAGGTAPLEECVLGETKADAVNLFEFEAAFGPFAQRPRSDDPDRGDLKRGAGGSKGFFWATARCPGDGARAVFRVAPTEYVYVDEEVTEFARKALGTFAERRAEQHGCTDLTLPAASS